MPEGSNTPRAQVKSCAPSANSDIWRKVGIQNACYTLNAIRLLRLARIYTQLPPKPRSYSCKYLTYLCRHEKGHSLH